MNVLVLFDGSGCVSEAAKDMGFNVKTLDILPLPHIDLPIDIMNFMPRMLNGFVPDFIWASPPCETWSIKTAMKGGGNMYWETIKTNNKVSDIVPRGNFDADKRLKFPERIKAKQYLHTRLLEKTVQIIDYYDNINPSLVWCIENPASGFMRHYLKNIKDGYVENVTTYCKYGSPYRKETSIFSNLKLALDWCPRKTKSGTNTCHHTDSFALRWDHKRQPIDQIIPQSYLERSTIPDQLCKSILKSVEVDWYNKRG